MYYYKARIYSPSLGRFLQVDPIGYEDQINLYAYVGNNPLNNLDPSGKETVCNASKTQCVTVANANGPRGGAPVRATDNVNTRSTEVVGTPLLDTAASEVAGQIDQRTGNEQVYRMDINSTTVSGSTILSVTTTQIKTNSSTPNSSSWDQKESRGAEAMLHTEPANSNSGAPGKGDYKVPDLQGVPNYQAHGANVSVIEHVGGKVQIRPVNHNITTGLRERANSFQRRMDK